MRREDGERGRAPSPSNPEAGVVTEWGIWGERAGAELRKCRSNRPVLSRKQASLSAEGDRESGESSGKDWEGLLKIWQHQGLSWDWK